VILPLRLTKIPSRKALAQQEGPQRFFGEMVPCLLTVELAREHRASGGAIS